MYNNNNKKMKLVYYIKMISSIKNKSTITNAKKVHYINIVIHINTFLRLYFKLNINLRIKIIKIIKKPYIKNIYAIILSIKQNQRTFKERLPLNQS